MLMKSKKLQLILLSLSIPLFSFGQEECDKPSDLEKVSKFVLDYKCANDELDNIFAADNLSRLDILCDNCKYSELDKTGNLAVLQGNALDTELKKNYAKSLLNEVRKNLANQVTELVQLRATNFSFDTKDVIGSCDLSKMAQLKCGKNGLTIDALLEKTLGPNNGLAQIQAQLANEIYNQLNPNSSKPGFFTRSNEKSCLSDHDYRKANESYTVSLIDKDFISKIKEYVSKNKVDFTKDPVVQIRDGLGRKDQKKLDKLKTHPFFKTILSSQKSFDRYFDNVKATSTTEELQDLLFNPDTSKELIGRIQNNCETISQKLKKSFCSEEFAQANISSIDPKAFPLMSEKDPFSLSQETDKNLALFCHGRKNKDPKALNYSDNRSDLTKHLPEDAKNLPYGNFVDNWYRDNTDSPKILVCTAANENPCTGKEEICKIADFFKNSKIPNSPESKLIASRNDSINAVLGSFVGTNPSVDKATKSYLIAQGIIPDDNGYIAQPTEDQKPQSPSSFAASQKQFASQNPKYSYNPPSKNGGTQTPPPAGQNNVPGFNPKTNTTNVGSKIGQNDQPDENNPFATDDLMQTKNGIINRLGKQIGARPRVAKDLSEISETATRKPLKSSRTQGMYRAGVSNSGTGPFNNINLIPEENRSKLTEGPKKKDEFNEAKQMMGQNRQPASDAGVATGGQSSGPSSSPNSPVVSVAANGDNVITLDTTSKDFEVSELVKQLKEKLNAEQLQIILESDKKIKVLVNGKEIILTPTPSGYLADSKEASLKKYLEAITAFFSEQLKDVARVDDLKKVFK